VTTDWDIRFTLEFLYKRHTNVCSSLDGECENKLKNYAVEIKATTTCSREIVGRKKALSLQVGTLCCWWNQWSGV